MRRILLAGLVVVVAFVAALFAMNWLSPQAPAVRPPVAAMPPLQPATRTSTVIAPVAIALTAIRDALDAQAPRDLAGKRDNPIGKLLQNAELGWNINRGPLSVSGRPEGLSIVAPLGGAFRLTGQISNQVGNIAGQLGGLIGGPVGEQLGNLSGKALDQRADVRGNVTLTARPALQPNWRLEPNLAAQANLSDTSLSVAGVRINVGKEVKPLIDRAVAEQVGALQARLRNDPMIEVAARREWAKMCRAIPLGKAAPGVADLWLEVRPTRAVAAQPKIDTAAVTLTVGVQAETRISPTETKPDCPFPATVEIVPPIEQGRLLVGVPIDMPFTEVNRLIEAQLKGKTFPEDRQGPTLVTINGATVTPSGDRLLISLRVKATETTSWFGLGAGAEVHVWGKPVLDAANQTLRLTDITLDVQSQEAFGLLGAAARAAIPYLKDALAANAQVDLKPLAANALKSIDAAIANFRNQQPGVTVDAAVTQLRLAGIEYDANTLRIIGEADGTVNVAVSSLAGK
jgi:uncharacterized protein DUF4403